MNVIRPTPISGAALLSSNVPEDDHPEWGSGTAYAKGDKVILASTHRRYESLTDANTSQPPATSPAAWLDLGPTNRWAMFDQAVGTHTSRASPLTVQIAPGGVDALAILDATATSATVTVASSGQTVYEKTQSFELGGIGITDWFTYFFEPAGRRTGVEFLDVPVYPDGVITVTLESDTSEVACGTLLVGRQFAFGDTQRGAQIGITDYSRKEANDFGVVSVVERAWSKRFNAQVVVPTLLVDTIQRELARLRARPALWIGGGGFESLTVYGFFREFSIDIAYDSVSYCSLTVEGLI